MQMLYTQNLRKHPIYYAAGSVRALETEPSQGRQVARQLRGRCHWGTSIRSLFGELVGPSGSCRWHGILYFSINTFTRRAHLVQEKQCHYKWHS